MKHTVHSRGGMVNAIKRLSEKPAKPAKPAKLHLKAPPQPKLPKPAY